jgi:hypothetical protein
MKSNRFDPLAIWFLVKYSSRRSSSEIINNNKKRPEGVILIRYTSRYVVTFLHLRMKEDIYSCIFHRLKDTIISCWVEIFFWNWLDYSENLSHPMENLGRLIDRSRAEQTVPLFVSLIVQEQQRRGTMLTWFYLLKAKQPYPTLRFCLVL